MIVIHRYRHQLIAIVSLIAGAILTWMLSATGTDGDFFRSLVYPWSCAAILLGGVALGSAVSVRNAVAVVVPFTAPQPLLAIWQGVIPQAGGGGLWMVGLIVSTMLMVFAVGCVAIGVCVRLMFRR